MVAQIAQGTAFDKQGRPFRRRNYLPGLLMLTVLAVVSMIIWVVALNRPPDVAEIAACNPPAEASSDPSQPKLGQQVNRASMIDVGPANLADAKVRVLNASGHGGQAADVAGQLRDLGFANPTAENDPLYTNNRLACQGQIRFGSNGRAAAAAVWLVAPCVELYQDQRPDDTVDLAIGTEFSQLASSDDINAVLSSLRPDATEAADPALVSEIPQRDVLTGSGCSGTEPLEGARLAQRVGEGTVDAR